MLNSIKLFSLFNRSSSEKILYERSPLDEKDLVKLQKIIFDLARSLNVPKSALDKTKVHIHPSNQMSVKTSISIKRNFKKNQFELQPRKYVICLKELDALILLGSKYKKDEIYEAFKRKDIKSLQEKIEPKNVLKTINRYQIQSYLKETPDEVKAGLAHEFGHIIKYWQDLSLKKNKLNYLKAILLIFLNFCLLGRLRMRYKQKHEGFADDFVNLDPTLRRAHQAFFQRIVDVKDASKELYFASIKTKPYPVRKLKEFRYKLREKIISISCIIFDPHRSNRQRAALADY